MPLLQEFQSLRYPAFDEGGAVQPLNAGFLYHLPGQHDQVPLQLHGMKTLTNNCTQQSAWWCDAKGGIIHEPSLIFRHDAQCLEVRRVDTERVVDTLFVRRLLAATDDASKMVRTHTGGKETYCRRRLNAL